MNWKKIEPALGRLVTWEQGTLIEHAVLILAREFSLTEDHVLDLMGNAKRMMEHDDYMLIDGEKLTPVSTVTLELRYGSDEIEPPESDSTWRQFGLIIEKFLADYIDYAQVQQIDITRPITFGLGETAQAVVSYSGPEFIKSAMRYLHRNHE